MKRAFVALELPDPLRARLALATPALPPGARAVPPDQLHLTLRFFGNVEDARYVALRERLGQVVRPAHTLRLEGPGTFPAEGPPQVLWLGLATSPALAELRAQIDDAAAEVGIARDPRPFAAHVTVARLGDVGRDALAPALEALAPLAEAELPVVAFTLYTSVLSHTGATHTVGRTYPLGA
jgi:2'-5' RNA ligase